MKKLRSHIGGTPSPARTIKRSQYGKQTTFFSSRKNGSQIVCEVRLEADACFLWEQDKNVVSYREQPERLTLEVEGKSRTYVPDFEVCYADGSKKFVEIKPENVFLKPKYLALYRAARDFLRDRGDDFELLTDNEIRKQPRLNNLIKTYSQARGVDPLELAYLRDQLRVLEAPMSIGDLLALPSAPSPASISAAIFELELRCDWTKPISTNSQVFWG
ncbi:MAG: transposase [Pseudomonas sp.]|uniref:Tn7 transposase TnsA N-terminal domain-containing protein n=1 Tax=Pseudomonas sp. FEMGT703P TaxID=2080764 RepID=UPI000CC7FC6B|nr:Tn7 transposase TnsA N-terminal domain-containing protein [Pseudomonas sp. FEMGT703P]PJE41937.1 MAG: transposase [Pseudomonas sp.] [Pseudomonas sp. FEMGT703P]